MKAKAFVLSVLVVLVSVLASGAALLTAQGSAARAVTAAAQEPRNVTVLVSAGQDTAAALAFFPQTVRIRAGDTVTWQVNSDEEHTVSFTAGATPVGPARPDPFGAPGEQIPPFAVPIPGTAGGAASSMVNPQLVFPTEVTTYGGSVYVNSGVIGRTPLTLPGLPTTETFSLAFDTLGTYRYICLIHPNFMGGSVEVAAADATDVPSQGEIDAQAQTEIAVIQALTERARAQGQTVRREPGPNDTTFWFVRAGNSQSGINDTRVQLFEFLPKDLTITSGDTVLWGAPILHFVTFNPTAPHPTFTVLETLAEGQTIVRTNPRVGIPAKPAGVFDPAQYFNSANLNFSAPGGQVWALTFERPGTFEYFCALHREQGMVGSITVLGR